MSRFRLTALKLNEEPADLVSLFADRVSRTIDNGYIIELPGSQDGRLALEIPAKREDQKIPWNQSFEGSVRACLANKHKEFRIFMRVRPCSSEAKLRYGFLRTSPSLLLMEMDGFCPHLPLKVKLGGESTALRGICCGTNLENKP